MSLRALMPIRYWSSCAQEPQDELRKNLSRAFGPLLSTRPLSANCTGPDSVHLGWKRDPSSLAWARHTPEAAGNTMKLSSRSICSRNVLHTRSTMRGGIAAVQVLFVVEIVLAARARVGCTTLVYGFHALIRAIVELLQSFKLLYIICMPCFIH